MKKNTLLKCVATAAAVAGIAYLVVRYFDTIHAWLCKLCPCCSLEDDFVIEDHFTPASNEPVEEAAVEEVPVQEDANTDSEKVPVADEADFEEE